MTKQEASSVHRAQCVALALWAAGLVACGDSTCPKGSISVDGDCVPVDACAPGEVEVEGECVMPDSGVPAGAEAEDTGVGPGEGPGEDASTGAVDAGQTAPPPADPCDALDCGEHGSCEVNGDAPACVCVEGFEGEACDACSAGLGPAADGACVPLCEGEAAPDCGAHGACVADDGAASCECEHPFAGELCSECAEGFALDDDGACQPDCGECGAHSYCDGTLMVPACTCVAGYRDEGNGCRWVGDGETGGIVDGQLDDEAAWETRHVTFADGKASFVHSGEGAACELGVLSQTLRMPAFEDAEPFVLELGALTSCTETNPADCPPLLVELGDSVTRVRVPGRSSPTMLTVSTCLGGSAYGEAVPLRIRPGLGKDGPSFSCANDDWPTLSSVSIRAASPGECPPEGGLYNGEFDNGSGWSLMGASVVDGALKLDALDAVSEPQAASTRVAFPQAADLPAAALRIAYSIVRGGVFSITLDGLIWTDFVFGSETAGITSSLFLCVPEWARGAVHELTLSTSGASIVIPSMAIETEARCGTGEFDHGFERALGTGSWHLGLGTGQVQTVGSAYEGANSLFIEDYAFLRSIARVPEPQANVAKHAAFQFWHRPNAANFSGSYTLSGVSSEAGVSVLFSQDVWASATPCIGRAWEGQLLPAQLMVQFILDSGTGRPTGWIDEAGPVLSETCD